MALSTIFRVPAKVVHAVRKLGSTAMQLIDIELKRSLPNPF